MLVKYRGSRVKRYKFQGKSYEISNTAWTQVPKVAMFLELRRYPQNFDTVAFFDVKALLPFDKFIEIKKDVIKTGHTGTIKKLKKMFNIKLQAVTEKGVHFFRILSYNQELLFSYEGAKNVTALIHRDKGGIGDIIMTTPFLEKAKDQFPLYKLIASYPRKFRPIIDGNPFVDQVVDFESIKEVDYEININLSLQCLRTEASTQPDVKMNRPEIFLDQAGLPYHDVPRPKIFLAPDEIINVRQSYNQLKIGLAIETAALARAWRHWDRLTDAIFEKWPEAVVYAFAEHKPKGWVGRDRVVEVFGCTLREVAAEINALDVMVAADTGLAHIAGAVNTKCVWLFTHIDGQIRAKNYDPELTWILQDIPSTCPVGKPCWYDIRCLSDADRSTKPTLCAETITVDQVMVKIDQAVRRPAISYIVLYHNNRDITKECLDRILAIKKFTDELIVLDNGSTGFTFDDLLADLRTASVPGSCLIRNDTNLGCILGRNQAAKAASGVRLFFLDNDQYISPHTMHYLMQIGKDVTAVEPWSMDEKGIAHHYSRRQGPLAYVGAGGMLVKKELFDSVGGFTEDYSPAWFEDPDFCFKAKEAGATLGYHPDPGVTHLKHKTNFTQTDYDANEVWYRNRDLFVQRWNHILRPDVYFSVVLLSYNRLETTLRCIKSLYEESTLPIEVIVLDQGSASGVVEKLEDLQYYNCKVIRGESNIGCGPGRNLAASHAIGRYIVFCDDDMIVSPAWDFGFLKRMKETEATAISPNVIEQKHDGKRWVRFFATEISNGSWREVNHMADPSSLKVLEQRQTDMVPGGSMVVRRDAFKDNPFDERFVFGLEDYDWCLTMREKGHIFFNCPSVTFVHFKPLGNRLIEQEPDANEILSNSALLFLHKWGDKLPALWNRSDFITLASRGRNVPNLGKFSINQIREYSASIAEGL